MSNGATCGLEQVVHGAAAHYRCIGYIRFKSWASICVGVDGRVQYACVRVLGDIDIDVGGDGWRWHWWVGCVSQRELLMWNHRRTVFPLRFCVPPDP